MERPEVEILLATYNGELYLREQIDSILGQDYPNLRLLASDDGSSDGTVAILNEYAARFPDRVRMLAEMEGSGHPRRNFLRLMKAATGEYIGFSDQDDVWIPEKVSLSMGALLQMENKNGKATPLLVFTDLVVVDERLQTLHPSFWKREGLWVKNVHRLQRVLGENAVTGCTAMINRSMCNLALQMPEEAEMHDRWICLLSAAFGAAEAIPQPTVLYRQHGNNVIGSAGQDTSIGALASRARESSGRRKDRIKCERQVEALLRLHGQQMKPRRREILEAYLRSGRSESAWERVGTTLRYGFFRSGLLRNAATIMELYKSRSIDED
jgi:glycosyltransferase involved in cell wall biosynthesis